MLRFGSCSLDVAARELRRDGEPVHLEPQAFDLLAYLVAHRDRVVPKTELLDEVWGDQFVSEAALTTRVKEVRRAVGDDGTRQEVVRNVRGRGYRFVAGVLEGSGPPAGPASRGVVGRDADVAAVVARLHPGSVVTIVGPGGVGKTTVAAQVAPALAPHLPHGVVTVDLGELERPDPVVPAVAGAARIVADAADVEAVAATLAGLDALLVLDGCEHVVAEVARLVRRLIAQTGSLRVLATSRERLGVPGEQVWPLLPLDAEAASELFLARAREANPHVAVGAGEEVREVVAALDHLPLAVEMAAARVAAVSFAELRDVVLADPSGLRSPDRGAPRRHRTLADVVAWSVASLDGAERAVLHGLAVFAGAVRLADVTGVLAGGDLDEARVADAVGRLVDRSLLAADLSAPVTRYRLLETVRAVTRAASDAPDVERRRGRHARWFLEVAQAADRGLRGPGEAAARQRLVEVAAELRAAHRWAVREAPPLAAELLAAVHHHAYYGLWAEPAAWAAELLAAVPEGAEASVAQAVLAADAANRGRIQESRRLVDQCLAGASEPARVLALEVLADLTLYEGRLDEARRWAAELRAAAEAAGDGQLVAVTLVNEALAWAYDGRPDAAEPALARLALLAPLLGPSGAGWHAYARAEVAPAPHVAVPLLREALDLGAAVDNHLLASVARTALAAAMVRAGEPGPALEAFEACFADAARHGNLTHVVTTIRNLVELLVGMGELERAAVLYGAVGRGGIRSSYGDEDARLAGLEGTLTERVPAGRLHELLAAGRALDLHQALAVALADARALQDA